MRSGWAHLALAFALGAGCDNPQPALQAVEPGQGHSDHDLRLLLLGRDFIPSAIVDPQSGRRIATSEGFSAQVGTGDTWIALTGLDWLGTGVLAASLPGAAAQHLPSGALDVRITDPRRRSSTLPGGFVELGPDHGKPGLAFITPPPGAPFVPGMAVRGSLRATETPPARLRQIGWTSFEKGVERAHGTCLPPAEAHTVDCDFLFTLGASLVAGDTVRIAAYVYDDALAANRADAEYVITIRARPTLTRIEPSRGGTAGGTDVIISGSGFEPGSQVVVDEDELLFPNGGLFVNSTTISGAMPAHAAGSVTVSVRTPLGDAVGTRPFTYLPPPRIATITPNLGSAAGGTPVTVTGSGFDGSTRIYFGATLAGAVPLADAFLQGETSIVGRTPAGIGVTTVWAASDTLGFTQLPGGFAWSTP